MCFYFNRFLEIFFTYHAIHSFKVYTAMFFSILMPTNSNILVKDGLLVRQWSHKIVLPRDIVILLCLSTHSVMFIQWWNCLMVYFSEYIPSLSDKWLYIHRVVQPSPVCVCNFIIFVCYSLVKYLHLASHLFYIH